MKEEMDLIQKELNTSKTEVLKRALHLLYNEVITNKKKQSLMEYLNSSGLIGAIEGEMDLSTNYKSIIDEGTISIRQLGL